ncbi:Cytochrome c oxidase protein 20, mitochondrial [Ophiocordyceps camponoti-floridani]|uniref:Cytochrome c oxidase assembly protein COX20, mitochondrial n=1 Tax=Ophiocordyceps camponoti-floridani TaxID=2030778 RepID=A0A8H4VD21_9HYPO|nr:Cytochrome c oxidase protein 20, mitochondrial [Ophiocordyceps camponoti-floridani]
MHDQPPNDPNEQRHPPETLHWPRPSPESERPPQPTISEAVATISKEDFLTIASKPCAREGLLTGIATGSLAGGLKFLLHGNVPKAANWAVGIFLVGSTASYEYCQFRRRAQRRAMVRQIEVVNDHRREVARKAVEEKRARRTEEEERAQAQKSWYRFW